MKKKLGIAGILMSGALLFGAMTAPVLAAEKALRDTKEQIKVAQRQSRLATNLDEQHEIQQRIQKLEKQQRRQRQEIFQVEDNIIEKRDGLIEALEKRLTQKTETRTLFTLEWAVV